MLFILNILKNILTLKADYKCKKQHYIYKKILLFVFIIDFLRLIVSF